MNIYTNWHVGQIRLFEIEKKIEIKIFIDTSLETPCRLSVTVLFSGISSFSFNNFCFFHQLTKNAMRWNPSPHADFYSTLPKSLASGS